MYSKTNLWNDNDMSIKCVITAGKNRLDRQQYIACYDDCEDWNISAVPSIINKTRAINVLNKVKREWPELNKKNSRKYSNDIELKIEDWKL